MTSIPTILKGDDSGQITLALPEGRDFSGATLVLAYSGVTRRFTGLSAGQTLSFGFTHEETSNFKLGCKPVLMRLIGPSGSVETVENAAMKIKVTDCLGEVNAGGSFVIRPHDITGSVPVTDVGDLSTTSKIGDLYDKVNEIVRVLAQRSLMALAFCLGLVAVADVQTARLEDLDRSSVVVTNVTGGSSVVETNVVTSIISNTVTKSFVEDLGISGGGSSGVDTNAVRDIALWPATNYTDRLVGELASSKADADYIPPAISNSTTRIDADLTVTETVDLGGWTPDVSTNGNVVYSNVYWETEFGGGGWACRISYIGGGSGGSIQMFGENNHNPDTTELAFPDGTKTYRKRTVTTKLATTNDLAAAISTNNSAFVSAVRSTPPDPETPWGTYSTLGAAIAGIIAALANKLTKGLSAQGVPLDANVAELFSESNTSLKGVIAAKTGTTSAAKSGDNIQLDDGGVVSASMDSQSTSLTITFGTARQANGLRFCELYVTNEDTANDKSIGSISGKVYSDISLTELPKLEKGATYYFTFAEFKVTQETVEGETVSVSHWKVSKQKLDAMGGDIPTPSAA